MRRPASTRALIAIAAAFWLSAGPGGVVLRAALACRHAAMAMQTGHHHHRMPGSGPCFCSQMVGAFDQTVSVAMPAMLVVGPAVTAPVLATAAPSPLSRFPSPAFPPESPPPNVA